MTPTEIQNLPFSKTIARPVLENQSAHRGKNRWLATLRNTDTASQVVYDIDPSHKSANWRKIAKGEFQGLAFKWNASRPAHLITLGDFKSIAISGLSDKKLQEFGKAIVHHEVRHGLHTSPDIQKTVDALKADKIPFRLFNLAEDVRIEEIARQQTGKKWGWTKWVSVQRRAYTPEDFIQTLRFTDGRKISRWQGNSVTARGRYAVTAMNDYWNAFRAAKTDTDLLPILKEWMLDFPASKGAYGPLTTGRINGEADANDAAPDGESVSAPTPKEIARQNLADQAKKVSPRLAQDAFNNSFKTTPNRAKVARITQELAQIITRADEEKIDYGMSSGRLIAHRAAAGEQSSFARRTSVNGRRVVTVIVDCSGSMCGVMESHIKPTLSALHALHARKMISLNVILTKSNGHVIVECDKIKGDWFNAISPGNGEGMRATLVANDALLKKSGTVIILTDGQLSDGYINAGEWRAKGVNLLGACALPAESNKRTLDARAALDKHFRKGFIHHLPHKLAKMIVEHIVQGR